MAQVRTLLALQALAFLLAALVHAGVLAGGYEHREAMIAESVIAGVLTLGLLATQAAPGRARAIGLGVQAFALVGTFVGLFTMWIGIGPQTAFDLVLHAGFVTLLAAGLIVVFRAGRRTLARV